MSVRDMRVDRLASKIEDGSLVRETWGDDDGECVCILSALSPEVHAAKSATACPPGVMPQWLAQVTPLLSDCGTPEKWQNMVQWYFRLVSRWHRLSVDAWARCEASAKRAALVEAMRHSDGEVRASYECAAHWLDSGDKDFPLYGPVVESSTLIKAIKATHPMSVAAAVTSTEALADSWARSEALRAERDIPEDRLYMVRIKATREAIDRMTDSILEAIETELVREGVNQ